MTWAMMLPRGFGDFWPLGQMTDARGKAEAQFNSALSQEERVEMPEGVHSQGVQAILANASRKCEMDLGALEPYEQGEVFETDKTEKSLASLIKLSNGLLAVDDPLKAIIEDLNPGVHQFWPLEIKMPKGKVYPTQYHALVVRRYLDSFTPKQSEPHSWRQMGRGSHYMVVRYPKKKEIMGLALAEEKIGSSHLWRERFLSAPEIFFSDLLKKRIDEAGLRIPKEHYKVQDV